jgi:polyisoprenoid-binding protein YceI
VSGLPNSVSVGDTFNIQVTGNLTILAATNPVTFNLTVNVLSEDEIGITGSTTIERDDYGITIPSVPFVASVEEEVVLELDLVAVARG